MPPTDIHGRAPPPPRPRLHATTSAAASPTSTRRLSCPRADTMRDGLPAIYRVPGRRRFGLRFIGGLETALDPIVATLDALPAYFYPELAPRDLLELLAAWLGLDVDESWPESRRREPSARRRSSGAAAARTGPRAALGIAFPDLPLRSRTGAR